MTHAFHFQHDWFFAIFLFCTALVLANVIHFVLFRLLRRKEAENTHLGWGLQRHLGAPSRAVFFITCLLIVLPVIPRLSGKLQELLNQIFIMALIAALGWFAVGCVYVLQNVFLRRYDLTAENNVQARRIHTQFQLFRRMVISLVIVIDVGALLWSFHDPRIWHYGTGLLASAGVASLILATAAKSTAANFLAGLQIAITEPIRIDDVVVVQGEWGRIEEITSAYVVIKIWDLRRLIVPLSYFIENSFQNWSREQSDIMGTAFLYVDYSIPVEELRGELNRIVQASALWDKKVCGLQVTNLSERTMELRCLVSSHNSSQNFDLRCLVREQMTAFIQKNYPDAFPTTRFSAHATSPGDPPVAGHL
ncbi:mechanosensitive ion channel family protein [Granulicella mallensis]|uniref:MscS Mechanosensitive ion channel n=1 Tax=Granulicella mallensis (strain ATCC BAA-1857 / DSM 23137 / MP5ACTX8) TaxID=682795 RepID=G8NVF0_GRAMM|nr:mechanosensitive ion channel domain-containing protein [Granulicella mallensis]AEU36531.1 MscS Mechanosensitive ion channel [Granulicella mallensis MP5ACTX8]